MQRYTNLFTIAKKMPTELILTMHFLHKSKIYRNFANADRFAGARPRD